jgi:hypothetical protein
MKRRKVPIVAGVIVALAAAYMLIEGWVANGDVKYAALVMLICGVVLATLEARAPSE